MPLMPNGETSPVIADERLRFLFSVARDPMLLLESTGDTGAARIVECNTPAARLLGYHHDDLVGMAYSRLIASTEPADGHEHLEAGEQLLRRSDGQVLIVEQATEPVATDDRELLLVSLHDLTTPRLLEKALLRIQQMDNLGIVSGAMVHDFRNLLLSIAASAELGLSHQPEPMPVRERLEEIVASAHRATEIVERILPVAGPREQPLERLSLTEVVQEAFALVAPAIPANVRVELSFPPGLDDIMGDATQLRQLVMNLLLNAREAMDEGGGVVRIRAYAGTGTPPDLHAFRPILVSPPESWLMLEVKDSGRGMDAATRDRIFEPLFTTRTNGTGLGLTAAFIAVKRHNAAIAVSSRPGHGTTFRLLFPLANDFTP